MSIAEIQSGVQSLPQGDRARFFPWVSEFMENQWDE